jgi:multidrug/hemolysin transport system ATP-binding protein
MLDRMGRQYDENKDMVSVRIKDTMDSIVILDCCKEYISNLEVRNGTMYEAFLAITGKEIRE